MPLNGSIAQLDRATAFKYFCEEINRSAMARNPIVESSKIGGNPLKSEAAINVLGIQMVPFKWV